MPVKHPTVLAPGTYTTVRGIALDGLADDKLIIQASPAEIAAVVFGQPVSAVQASLPGVHGACMRSLIEDQYLYDRHGNRIAYVRGFSRNRDMIDVSTHHGGSHQIPGFISVRIDAEGIM